MHPDRLRQHIEKNVSITDNEYEVILSHFTHRKIKKNQFLLHEGARCSFDAFVVSGALRMYHMDSRGKEYVFQFAFEDWWISDWYAILHQTPSAYNIDAIEDSEILHLEVEALNSLIEKVPKIEKYFRTIFQHGFAALQRRVLWLQTPADERYRSFLSVYAKFEQRVSQAQIASYLGITRESLNRLKNSERITK